MTLDELLKQKAELDRKIGIHQHEGRNRAIAEIQEIMAQHGLTAADVTAASRRASGGGADVTRVSKPVAAKYKDGQGNSWTGRGLKPKWLTAALASGKKIEDFAL